MINTIRSQLARAIVYLARAVAPQPIDDALTVATRPIWQTDGRGGPGPVIRD